MFTIEDANENKKVFEAGVEHGEIFDGWMVDDSYCDRIIQVCKEYLGLRIEKSQAIRAISLVTDAGRNYWNHGVLHRRLVAWRISEAIEEATGVEMTLRDVDDGFEEDE